ncbi:MAG: hypothetical protein ABUT39_11540 [Acidobacteriota bacterium]
MNQPRLDNFTAAIGYSELPPPATPGYGLAPSWQEEDLERALGGQDWTLTSELVWHEKMGNVRDLCFVHENEVVTVTIFVSAEGDKAARQWFLDRASASTVPEIPFRRSDDLELGQLAVETEGPLMREILWLFHNLAFDVRAIRTQASARAVAERLQQRAAGSEEGVRDLSPSFPRMAAREESAPSTKVGDVLRVPLLEQPPSDLLRRYEVEVRTGGEALDFMGFEGNEALFEAQAPGIDSFEINVIDRSTLLSNQIKANIEVQPLPVQRDRLEPGGEGEVSIQEETRR